MVPTSFNSLYSIRDLAHTFHETRHRTYKSAKRPCVPQSSNTCFLNRESYVVRHSNVQLVVIKACD